VQPKVLVKEVREAPSMKTKRSAPRERSAIHAPDLIVKSAGAEYPGLAENEFLCMSLARAAGLDVPECWLSEDRTLFVIRRFDLAPAGGYLGFEDAASLTGRHPRDKYHANYADIARAVADFCAVRHRADSLERFFRQLVFCCLIRDGDAHLKNARSGSTPTRAPKRGRRSVPRRSLRRAPSRRRDLQRTGRVADEMLATLRAVAMLISRSAET
jgi:serine/threonine-protein kinase HipA